jgi:transposase, IS30 family
VFRPNNSALDHSEDCYARLYPGLGARRGSNENTNGLLRQYFPRRTNLSTISQARLDALALRLNTRPRMTLGYQTPAAKLSEIVASIG